MAPLLLFIAWIVMIVLFIVNLQRTIALISPHIRKIDPGTAWIILFPFIGSIWQIAFAKKLATYIELELKERGIPIKPQPTYLAGLWSGISNIVMILAAFMHLGIITSLLAFAPLILMIVYWVQVAQFKKVLKNSAPHILPQKFNL